MPPLTYFQFHALFVLPPLVVLAATLRSRRRGGGLRRWLGVAVVGVIALAYTIPWDNLLIATGVWTYGDGATAFTLWHAPLGEYVFILVQPLVTALWLFHLPTEREPVGTSLRQRVGGVAAGLAVSAVGLALLTTQSTLYLGAILAWSGPVLAIQWGVGWPFLWRNRRLVAVAIGVPTLYFCAADRIALSLDIWILSSTYTTGLTVVGLPVEEGAFFLLTNTFVVQGLTLYEWVCDRIDAGEITSPAWAPVGR
ncbi:MAG: lycopene cyclase domain-containing protein [Halolamina sp.]